MLALPDRLTLAAPQLLILVREAVAMVGAGDADVNGDDLREWLQTARRTLAAIDGDSHGRA